MTQGVAERTAVNSLSNVAGWLWPTLLSIVTVPYMVGRMGMAAYGIYALTFLVIGYFGLLDFNLTVGLTKYVAECHELGDRRRMGQTIGSGIAFAGAMGLVGGVAIIVFAPFGPGLFKVPPAMTGQAVVAFRLAGAGFLLSVLGGAYSCVPAGLSQYGAVARLNAIFATVSVALVIAALVAGTGVVGAVAASTLGVAARTVAFFLLTRRLLPPREYPRTWSAGEARRLAIFSAASFLGRVSGEMDLTVDRLVVGGMLGVGVLPLYTVPNNLAARLTTFSYQMTQVVMPVASGMTASGDWARLRRAYLRVTRLVLVVNTGLAAVAVVVARPFLTVWMGAGFADRTWVLMTVVVVAYYVIELTNVPSHIIDGAGRPIVNGVFSALQAVLNLALLIPLVNLMGVLGGGVAFLVPALIMVPVYIAYAHHKVIGVRASEYLREIARPLAAGVFATAGGLAVVSVLGTTVISVVASAATTVVLYVLATALLGAVDADDRALFSSMLGRVTARPGSMKAEATDA